MTVTASPSRELSRLDVFQPPADQTPDAEHLFTGPAYYFIQTPPERNDYKKKSGSSDGAHTYDTTAT